MSRKVHAISLAEAISQNPHLCDERSLNLVDKYISSIGQIPVRFRSAEILYLSHNRLHSLSELSQFSSLKSLSLAYNSLSSLEVLKPLKRFKALEHLNFEGNGLTSSPSYRAMILQMFPNLKSLDTKAVHPPEKQTEPSKKSSYVDAILSYEYKAAKLENLARRLCITKELIQKDRLMVYHAVDIQRYLNYSTLEWPARLIHQIKICLEGKVKEVLQTGSDWEFAYNECIATQQEYIARLLNVCEERSNQCTALWKARSEILPAALPQPTPKPKSPFQESYNKKLDKTNPTRHNIPNTRNQKLELKKGSPDLEKINKVITENQQLKDKLNEFQSTLQKASCRLEEVLMENEHMRLAQEQQNQRLDVALNRNKLLDEQIDILRTSKDLDSSFIDILADDYSEVVKAFKETQLAKRIFAKLKHGFYREKKKKILKERIRNREFLYCVKRTWNAWVKFHNVENFVKGKVKEIGNRRVKDLFFIWRLWTDGELLVKGLRIRRGMKNGFNGIKKFAFENRKAEIAYCFHMKTVFKTFCKGISKIKTLRRSAEIFQDKKRINRQRKILFKWIRLIFCKSITKTEDLRHVQRRLFHKWRFLTLSNSKRFFECKTKTLISGKLKAKLKQSVFGKWKKWIVNKRYLNSKLEIFTSNYKKEQQKNYLHKWRIQFFESVIKKNDDNHVEEIESFRNVLEESKKQILLLQREMKSLKSYESDLSQRNKLLEEEKDSLKAMIKDSTIALEESKNQVNLLQEEMNSLKSSESQSKQRDISLEDENALLREEIETCTNSLEDYKKQANILEEEINSLKTSDSYRQLKDKSLENENESLRQEIEDAKKALEDSRKQANLLQEEIKSLKSSEQHLKQKDRSLENENALLRDESQALHRRISIRDSKLSQLEEKNENANKREKDQIKKEELLQEKVNELNELCKSLTKELAFTDKVMKKNQDDFHRQIEQLKKENRSLEQEIIRDQSRLSQSLRLCPAVDFPRQESPKENKNNSMSIDLVSLINDKVQKIQDKLNNKNIF